MAPNQALCHNCTKSNGEFWTLPEIITKVTPISELIDDVDASALGAARKLERRHAWAELRALC